MLLRRGSQGSKDELGSKKNERQSDLMKIHQELGHPSADLTRKNRLKMNLKMKVSMQHCKGCGMGKTKQKKTNKQLVPRVKKVGERTFIDISSIKYESAGDAKFWACFMDN